MGRHVIDRVLPVFAPLVAAASALALVYLLGFGDRTDPLTSEVAIVIGSILFVPSLLVTGIVVLCKYTSMNDSQ